MMMLSRIGRSVSKSSRSSFANASYVRDGYGARAAVANQLAAPNASMPDSDSGLGFGYGGRAAIPNQFVAPNRSFACADCGLGFLRGYFTSVGAGSGKELASSSSYLSASDPILANPIFSRSFSSGVHSKANSGSLGLKIPETSTYATLADSNEKNDKGGEQPLSPNTHDLGSGNVTNNSKTNILRPLSPHLPVYQPQLTSTLSILNRMSAAYLVGITLAFYLVYMKLSLICFSFSSFYQFFFYSSKLATVSLEIAALAMVYHTYSGIRHLLADFSGTSFLKRLK